MGNHLIAVTSRLVLLKPQPAKVKRSPERLAVGVYRIVAAVPQETTAVPAEFGVSLEECPEPQVVTVPGPEGDTRRESTIRRLPAVQVSGDRLSELARRMDANRRRVEVGQPGSQSH